MKTKINFIAKWNEYNVKFNSEKASYLSTEVSNCNGDQWKLHSLINKLTFGSKNISYPNCNYLTLANNFGIFFKKTKLKIV